MLSFCLLLFWDHWPGHWWSGVQRWRGRCRLLWMLFMKGADQLPEVHDCQWRLLGVFFFWVALPRDEVVEVWYLVAVYLLNVHCTVNDCFDLVLLVVPASNFMSFSGSGSALSTSPFLVVSCSSSNTWNILCIFHLVGSSNLYASFPTTWRTRKGPKNFFSSFLFLFVLMYLLFSQTFLLEA